MWPDTAASRLFGVRWPIVQAPLAGGPGTPELSAAVSQAGGLGILGLGYLDPDGISAAVHRVRQLTDRPFGANLFLPAPPHVPDQGVLDRARQALVPFREAVGLDGLPPIDDLYGYNVDDQLTALLEADAPIIGFTFGVPGRRLGERVRGNGAILMGTATTPDEGRALRDAGVDVVVAQGAEAGGHRGSFEPGGPLIGLVALVPRLADTLSIPVLAAGGISDGRGILAAMTLGAAGAQLGTAFLTCDEAGTSAAYRAAVAAADSADTVVTDRFSGRPARGIRNRFIEEFPDLPIPDYPVMHALTRELRARAAREHRAEYLSLWAGQGVGQHRGGPAGQLVSDLAAEVEAALRRR